jgi:CubicO group peptidase (beta-lactamase class C family)
MKNTVMACCVLCFALCGAAARAQDAAQAGLDAEKLRLIPVRMNEFVAQGQIAGAVTLVQRNGRLASLQAVGLRDIEAKDPMKTDTIFQIMSMTKPFTGAAILMLAEEGKLRLLDPVEKHLPEFRGQWMVEARGADGKQTLRKPARPITIRDLMTHTSGLVANPPPSLGELLRTMDRTLAEAVAIYGQTPLEFEPGSRWMYSNPGIATLGRIVEVRSGMAFEQFLEQRIFAPLGMKDTHIFLPKEKRPRLAPVYTVKDGKLVKAGAGILAGDPMNYREGAKYSGPEYALHSTAPDLARFYQMLLDRGAAGGQRILSPWAVEVMATLHTGALKAGHNAGTGFGLTVEVTADRDALLYGWFPGSFGHGGAFGTHGLIDRKNRIVTVFLIQLAGDARPVRDPFYQMVAASAPE